MAEGVGVDACDFPSLDRGNNVCGGVGVGAGILTSTSYISKEVGSETLVCSWWVVRGRV